ncbi:Ankyrin repeat [Dillenia turbinata]|uniref:Ankyrin repeat n=1 Tax=Dillenia turbinata TaxID=194707 RepID=A0AAN8W405_9MAGN
MEDEYSNSNHPKKVLPRTNTLGPNVDSDTDQPESPTPSEKQAKARENLNKYLPLYKAALRGDWETAKAIFDGNESALTAKITIFQENALHLAAGAGHAQFVINMMDRMPVEDLELRDVHGRTALTFAAMAGCTEAARAMVSRNPILTQLMDKNGRAPILHAALIGSKDVLSYLCSVTRNEEPNYPLSGQAGGRLLNNIIAGDYYDVALQLLQEYPALALCREESRVTPLDVLAQRPSAFPSATHLSFWQRLIYSSISLNRRNEENYSQYGGRGDTENPSQNPSTTHANMLLLVVTGYRRMKDLTPNLATRKDESGTTALEVLAQRPIAYAGIKVNQSDRDIDRGYGRGDAENPPESSANWSLMEDEDSNSKDPKKVVRRTNTLGPNVDSDPDQPESPTTSSERQAKAKENLNKYLPLYKAALRGDWETAKAIFDGDESALTAKITFFEENALHLAAGAGHAQFVINMMDRIPVDDLELYLELRDVHGRTALTFAAMAGCTEAARAMLSRNPRLTQLMDKNGRAPILDAALIGSKDVLSYLCSVTHNEEPNYPLRGEAGGRLLNNIIASDHYDVALQLLQKYPELALCRDESRVTPLDVLAQRPSAFPSAAHLSFLQRLIYSSISLNHRNEEDYSQYSGKGDTENPSQNPDTTHANMLLLVVTGNP